MATPGACRRTRRLIGSPKRWDRGGALTSTLHWFETELLTRAENLVGLTAVNRELLAQAEQPIRAGRIVLDMDSSESPVHGEQEGSAYNGHFATVCYHPLFLFNEHGDCLAAMLRPGNVPSAEDWDDLLLPELDRQQAEGKRVAFRADAALLTGGGIALPPFRPSDTKTPRLVLSAPVLTGGGIALPPFRPSDTKTPRLVLSAPTG